MGLNQWGLLMELSLVLVKKVRVGSERGKSEGGKARLTSYDSIPQLDNYFSV